MNVVAPAEVAPFVRAHGGRLFVWTDVRRCCSGGMTYLKTGAAPEHGRTFRRFDAPGFELYLDPGAMAPPDELHLEVKGRRRQHVEAYWNGCVFAV